MKKVIHYFPLENLEHFLKFGELSSYIYLFIQICLFKRNLNLSKNRLNPGMAHVCALCYPSERAEPHSSSELTHKRNPLNKVLLVARLPPGDRFLVPGPG